ncbi:Uncharacterised protein [Candidatus Bilamarchaeum dharawalense]|uniref:DUF1893 domain-containing protein n=1 Tax=Candidatus Bilamarchaeum dharawalense TaxID=2885759 RepID=A0A5E4LTL1_9ARCH|nr:Uncharacterised protein [Candidatus Bilamarchaeum dharawalense]
MIFSKYSLVLVNEDKVVFQSSLSGLRPLVECVKTNAGGNCILYDKVIGLAAARIIVHSGLISKVVTPLASYPAKKLLEEDGITVEADEVVEKILNKDKTAPCPMEVKALEMDNEQFFKFMIGKFGG